jgi:hypothetical protein
MVGLLVPRSYRSSSSARRGGSGGWALPAALLLLFGCGEATSHKLGGAFAQGGVTDDSVVPALRVGLCGAGADLELIDDMEDGNQAILKTGGRSGTWFSFNDLSSASEQFPLMGAQIFPMSELEPARRGSHYAVHTYGSGFSGWGAGIGFELSSSLPYDASGYAGIAFWARVPDGSADWRVNVTDRNTSQYGRVCDLDCQADVGPTPSVEQTDGHCDPDAGPCHDYFGADLNGSLASEWKLFAYSWAQISTKNWSNKGLTSIVTSAIYGLRFQANGPAPGGVSQPFDMWLDDVAFLCR